MRGEISLVARLFVYGTLRSGGSAGHLLTAAAVRRHSATLGGYALYGRTWPYPFVAPKPEGEVVGEVVVLEPRSANDLIADLDRYEGPEYRRTVAMVRVGENPMSAHLWEAADTTLLVEGERIPSGDWFER